MTPNQHKVHKCLSIDEPMTRMELSRKTGLNYNAVHKAMVYLMETGHATSICIDKVAHYSLAAEVTPCIETTVARACRTQPNSVWALGRPQHQSF